jgi:hypothetical protein
MLLASRIAWRNEPVPESLVFVTVKTKGVTLCHCVGPSWETLALGTRLAEVECLNALAKLEASQIEPIDNKATASVIRRAKA